jgi:GNAT superfamily N-acetyltransferase
MKIDVHHSCADFDSYRTARVKSLFNVESGADVHISAELPIDAQDWQIGVVVGASGTGKTTIGKNLWPGVKPFAPKWPKDQPIIDAICPDSEFDAVPAALSAVGLGSVPAWLRPYHVLSNGEQFRANLARAVCEAPSQLIIDEFSSVVDRQIACIGANAFAKAWRRTKGQAVLLTCHYDVLDWLQPDWVFDTSTGEFFRGWKRQKPCIELEVWETTNSAYWKTFEPHHYLKLSNVIAPTYYVGIVNGEMVAHLAITTRQGMVEARACRFVVKPEWQGLGIGLTFLNAVCEAWASGRNRYGKPLPTLINTSHPALCRTLRKHNKWWQVSGRLVGYTNIQNTTKGTYGWHWRSIQGFRYLITAPPST